jgi:Flp pilus assembly protein TadG
MLDPHCPSVPDSSSAGASATGESRATPTRGNRRRRRTRGGAVLELALLSPWVFFLFIGVLDWGFYGYALISMQAAARSAVLFTSATPGAASDLTNACKIVVKELSTLPNIGTAPNDCSSNPVVTATPIMGPDLANAAQISVRYQTITLIPIPGLLAKQFTFNKVVIMRIRS